MNEHIFREYDIRGIADAELLDDDVMLLDHAGDGDRGSPREGRVLDLAIERLLAHEVERAGHIPDDVVREAGQDHRVVGAAKALHVALDYVLVLAHGAETTPTWRAMPIAIHNLHHAHIPVAYPRRFPLH